MSAVRPRPKPRPHHTRTEAEWVQHFGIKESVITDSVIQYGIDLLQAKSELPHGRWLPFLATLGISPDTAQERMNIGRMGLRSRNENSVFAWPTRIGALTEISRWPDEQVTHAIESGIVNADTTEADLKSWKKQFTEQDAVTTEHVDTKKNSSGSNPKLKYLNQIEKIAIKMPGEDGYTQDEVSVYNRIIDLLEAPLM